MGAVDTFAPRTECLEPMVRDAMMDALFLRDKWVENAFVEWLTDESPHEFIYAMLQHEDPDGPTRREIIDRFRLQWVNETIEDLGWETVSRFFQLGVGQ